MEDDLSHSLDGGYWGACKTNKRSTKKRAIGEILADDSFDDDFCPAKSMSLNVLHLHWPILLESKEKSNNKSKKSKKSKKMPKSKDKSNSTELEGIFWKRAFRELWSDFRMI